MTLLPDSHIPGSGHSGTSPFLPMAHVSVTDKHRSPFSTSGPPGGAQGLLTRNGHIPPRGIIAHLTAGLGGGGRVGKEAAPFWNSALFPSQRRSLSLPAWASASSSVTLCDPEGHCGAVPQHRVASRCFSAGQAQLSRAAGNFPYTTA